MPSFGAGNDRRLPVGLAPIGSQPMAPADRQALEEPARLSSLVTTTGDVNCRALLANIAAPSTAVMTFSKKVLYLSRCASPSFRQLSTLPPDLPDCAYFCLDDREIVKRVKTWLRDGVCFPRWSRTARQNCCGWFLPLIERKRQPQAPVERLSTLRRVDRLRDLARGVTTPHSDVWC